MTCLIDMLHDFIPSREDLGANIAFELGLFFLPGALFTSSTLFATCLLLLILLILSSWRLLLLLIWLLFLLRLWLIFGSSALAALFLTTFFVVIFIPI